MPGRGEIKLSSAEVDFSSNKNFWFAAVRWMVEAFSSEMWITRAVARRVRDSDADMDSCSIDRRGGCRRCVA